MPIDFHAEKNRYSYASRQADVSWHTMIESIISVRGKYAVDIACGGGIYTKALANMGAEHVTGIDFSTEMLKAAQESCQGYKNIRFVVGNALETGLPDKQYDLVLERGLTHHIKAEDLVPCFAEALRLLKPGGIFIVQNRTPEDCELPASSTNIRGYFFLRYPRLLEIEVARRPDGTKTMAALQEAGFREIRQQYVWETRATYPGFAELADDLLGRTGRSILHELTDGELQDLVEYMREQLAGNSQPIVELGRWTVWSGRR